MYPYLYAVNHLDHHIKQLILILPDGAPPITGADHKPPLLRLNQVSLNDLTDT